MREELTHIIPYASIEAGARDLPRARVVLAGTLLWGGELQRVAHVAAKKRIRVADLGFDLGGGDVEIARMKEGELALVLPNGTLVPRGSRMSLRLGRAVLRLELVADDVAAPPRPGLDRRFAFGIIAAAVLHAALVGSIVHGRGSEATIEAGQRAELERYMMSIEQRAAAELAGSLAQAKESDDIGSLELTAAGDPGVSGHVTSAELDRQRRQTRGLEARPTTRPSEEEVASFGILALISGEGQRAGSSAFAADVGRSAMGNIFGTTIGEAQGFAAVDLSGTGLGGGGSGAGLGLSGIGTMYGGRGEGIGLGNIGTLGRAGGTAAAAAAGGREAMFREHRVASVSCRCGGTQVNGRLPPEVIQRVVRANFGRFRACYEQGLTRDPGLEGRISVKFVIGRSGAVEMTSVEDRSLSDASVAACVAKRFDALSFPEPAGGIVTVVYPIVFSST
jgi:hypothetical protein